MADVFRTLVVPVAYVELARQIAASFGPGGEGMWTTPCSPDGKEPETWNIASGYVPPEYNYLVPLQMWEWVRAQDGTGAWVQTGSEPGDPVAVYQAASAAGVVCTQADVDALFAAADVTQQDPFVAMGRLGIQLVQTFDS